MCIRDRIEGVPVCADFTTRHARMEGGLRHPVRMRILEGKTVLFNTLITGRRRSDDPPQRTYVSDDNARYKVEWAPVSYTHLRPCAASA